MYTTNLSLKTAKPGEPEGDLLQLSLLASANENGVVFNNDRGEIFWVNESFCKMIGYPENEVIGKNTLFFCMGALTKSTIIRDIAHSIGKKQSFSEELIHYRKDGTWFWGRVKGQSFKTVDGELRYFAVVEDITQEKEKEEKLKVLSKIAEDNINAVILTDKQGCITWINKSFTKITGYTLNEVVNKKPGHLLQGPDTDKNTVAYLKKQISSGQPFNTEILNYAKSGATYWVRIQGQPIRNAGGELTGFFALEENITKERDAAGFIKESEARFRLALEKIGDNVWEYNFKTGKIFFSKSTTELGYASHKIKGTEMFWWQIANSDELKRAKGIYKNYTSGVIDSHNEEYSVLGVDGSIRWILDRGVVIEKEEDGSPVRIIGTHTDITKIKKTETELEQRVKQFKSLSENIPGVIYEYEFKPDGSQGLRYISPAIERVFGISVEDFGNYLNYIGPEDRARIIKKNEHSKNTLEPFYDESILNIPGGGIRWHSVHSSFSYVDQNGAKVFTGFMTDITERKNIEDALKAREGKYRNIIANMNLGLIEVDNYEYITFANNSFCEMSGYSLKELIGKNARTLLAKTESINTFKDKKELREKGVADAYQVKLTNKKGEEKWWLISGAPRYDDSGELVGSIGIHLDITAQKKQESELIEARKHAEHLARTQEIFLANMSHEIRTPMNAIIGMSTQLAKTNLLPQQQFFLEVVHAASENLLVIINDILDLSKIEAGKLNIENIGFEIRQSAKRVIQVMAHRAEEKGLVLIDSFFDEAISPVLIGDPYRLNQVLLNLISNAVKFTEKGTVDLQFRLKKDLPGSQLIEVEVTDTGIGMDKDFLDQLFDKFSQESKSVSRGFGGTGLGMSICKDLIELMGGNIHAESEKDKGTRITFQIELKKGDQGDLPEKIDQDFHTDFLKDKNILVTDDNEFNRLVASVILQNNGALVTESTGGSQTIELLKKHRFDAILMDIQMPGMTGFEATRIIRKNGYTCPVIALTAEAIKGEREKCLAAGMNDYITKPINEEVFLKTLDKWVSCPCQASNKPPSKMNEEQLYDLSSLKAISRGNEAFVQKMVNIFCDQTPEMLDQIEGSYKSGNLDKVRETAHKMKPSIDNLNITGLKQVIRDIEQIEEDGFDRQKMTEKINKLKQTIGLVIEKIRVEYPG